MFETTILCSTDIDDILRAAEVRKENDRKFATYLLETLTAAARGSNLKQRFWEAVYDRRTTRFLLHQLHIMQSYGTLTYNVEDIVNEYDVLERLAVACGKKIVSNYAINGSNVNVYLEFVPELQSAVLPTTSDELAERRLEKETSW